MKVEIDYENKIYEYDFPGEKLMRNKKICHDPKRPLHRGLMQMLL